MVYRRSRRSLLRKKRSSPRRRVYRKRTLNPRSRRVKSMEFASLKEIVSTNVVAGGLYDFSAFALSDVALERAPMVAKAYQYFKITKIGFRLIANTDTYPVNGGFAVPQVYWMINKGQSIPAGITADELLDMGCRPRALNDKNLTWAFAPAVLNANRNLAGGLVSLYPRITPWLDTNTNAGTGVGWAPSTTEHGGFLFHISKMNADDATAYSVQITYHFKFMKPLYPSSSSSPSEQYIKVQGANTPAPAEVSP